MHVLGEFGFTFNRLFLFDKEVLRYLIQKFHTHQNIEPENYKQFEYLFVFIFSNRLIAKKNISCLKIVAYSPLF